MSNEIDYSELIGKKVLSVRQPWAWLIVQGIKDIENRNWQTAYRGELLIHAGKHWDADAKRDINGYDSELTRDIRKAEAAGEIFFGGIIGKVMLDDVVKNSFSEWAEPGLFHWKVSNAQTMPFVPCRGQLGLYTFKNN